jgi:DNA repair protein RadC
LSPKKQVKHDINQYLQHLELPTIGIERNTVLHKAFPHSIRRSFKHILPLRINYLSREEQSMHDKSNSINNKTKHYFKGNPMTDKQVLEAAAEILACKYVKRDSYTSSQATKDFLSFKLGKYEREVFAVMLLDSQHKLIDCTELFFGTIDAAAIYPREVVKLVLSENAAAVIFAHNHPSGINEPSVADKNITKRLQEALALIDVRVLDHIIIGDGTYSFAEMLRKTAN